MTSGFYAGLRGKPRTIEFGRDWYEHDLRFEVAWSRRPARCTMAEPNAGGITTESVTVEIWR
jgi:hypothetical protein